MGRRSVPWRLRRSRSFAADGQYRAVIEESPIPIFIYERETLRIVAVSNSVLDNYGYSRKELLAMTVPDLNPEEDLAAYHAYRERVLQGEHPGRQHWTGTWRHKYKDGSIIEIDVTGNDIVFDGRACRVAFCPDVTERNAAARELARAREELAANEARYRLLFDRNPQPMLLFDRRTLQILAFNDAQVAHVGYSQKEARAMSVLDLLAPENAAALRTLIEETPGGRARWERNEMSHTPQRARCKDGTIVDIELSNQNIDLDGRPCRISVAIDVTERNRVAAELERAYDRAVEASNMKSAFLANMSHELRTPMNGVIGMNNLLLESELNDEQRGFAEQVARSGLHMLEIINDILDVSKLEAGHLELDVTTFEVPQSIDDACAAPSADATAKGLGFEIKIAPEVPRVVCGDRRRLAQVLANLASNAVKFTTDGAVTVSVTALTPNARQVALRIAVNDTGIGIEPAVLERMFEPFSQADVSTTRTYGGTGLGLAIVRDLVELMDGTVTAESEPGRGSTFTVELMMDRPTRAGETPDTLSPTADRALPAWSAPPLVLVVEDSSVNQLVATRTLERCGCRAAVAPDGNAALTELERHPYDAVLMDCQMPVLDGYAATSELRRREAGSGRHTPVIAMTAHVMEGDREHCLQAGMDDYIAKPMRRDELAAVLRHWIPDTAPLV
jgi:PAS domain S-box-containing protein